MEIPPYPNQYLYCDPETQSELDTLKDIVAAVQRLIDEAEMIVLPSNTSTPYTLEMVRASDLADVLAGKLR